MRSCVLWVFIGLLAGLAHGQNLLPGLLTGGPLSGSSPPMPVNVPPVGNINFATTRRLVITLRPDQTASMYVWIVSDKDSPNGVQFYLSLRRSSDSTPCRASVITLPTASGFQKDASRPIPIEITGCGGYETEGSLGILGSSGAHREIPIVVKRGASHWVTGILFASLALAVSIALVCGAIVRAHGHKLADVIGDSSWNFSSSWASNIAAFGTAFSALIQLTMFPEKPWFGSRSEYAFLAAFSLALVALAPAVQQLTSRTRIDQSNGKPVLTTNSIVFGFLLASGFTMSGTFLQIALQILIILELGTAAIINKPTTICAGLFEVFSGVGLTIYCWRTILTTIAANAGRTGAISGMVAKRGVLRTFSAPAVDTATAASREISVL